MKVLRSKRPDKIECSWDGWTVELTEEGEVDITSNSRAFLFIHNDKDLKSLIEALQIILDSK